MNEKRFIKKMNKFSKHHSNTTHKYDATRFARLCERYFGIAKFIVDINKGVDDYETTLFEEFSNKRDDVIRYI